MMEPRDYQKFAVDSIFHYFENGGTGNPIVAMPTGTGKSPVMAFFIREVMQRFPGQRILKLTHVKELIEQNLRSLLAVWPTAPVGVYSAGVGRKELGYPITYGGVDSVVNALDHLGWVDLVLIDECHLVSPKEGTMYQKIIASLAATNPAVKVIGLTATHYRLGQGMLTEDDGIFTDVCVDMVSMEAFNWFIDQGYLCPLVPRPTSTMLDVSGVPMQRGDYHQGKLQAAVNREEITAAALRETLELAKDRHHWLVFASGIEHAENVAAMLDALGVSATCVHSKMPKKERDANIKGAREGRFQAIVNNGILTTGYDHPALDLIVGLRPTGSPGLWVQMLGRGTRPFYADGFDLSTAEGRLAAIANSQKRNCLVLDFAANTAKLGPINDPVLPKRRGKGNGKAPVRICESCGIYCHASARACPECGFVFPVSTKLATMAGSDQLIARPEQPLVDLFPVDRVIFKEHRKEGSPNSLRATYYCGLRKFDEWICLEHRGWPRKKAEEWWRARAKTPPPATVLEAFERAKELQTPERIRVWVNKKYPEILGYEYSQ